jgi:NACalpha-BTF3-like transcription factor
MANSDPNKEPENSTVDDWLGQQVNEDAEKVDEALAETGGDEDAAMEKLERES